ncbi:hypothetical protein NF556_05795 [Ornithinimicrobium faecis]|uniref:SseB protein N-terminal domain-containing protein n=1 Tax=Ornithinimicrobium faecis TaxID=2934158 RepID=A0ABY4YWL1_9MICO|nr:hypothetical protein [Ornithinimicrobium sp. HY1793]USQ81157.1 hypothetical protein NF556_05795 [Ornithinimicrobium sp. HY1793]
MSEPNNDGFPGQPDAAEEGAEAAPAASPDAPAPSETDRLAAQVTGPEDQVGMAALWRLTMGLDHWWFIAVGDPGLESPAAAEIDGQLMLLTFTTSERAHDFAVQQDMIGPTDDLNAIALPPGEVIESSATYVGAGIHGLMFDPHISGFFIPSEQLPVVWEAVTSTRDAD